VDKEKAQFRWEYVIEASLVLLLQHMTYPCEQHNRQVEHQNDGCICEKCVVLQEEESNAGEICKRSEAVVSTWLKDWQVSIHT
jgi:hypothetical protein